MRESSQVMSILPEISSIDYDFKTGKMIRDEKEITPTDLMRIIEAAGKTRTFDKGIGLSTSQRAIITASAMREAEGGALARADRGRGNRLVKEQRSLLYMPAAEKSPMGDKSPKDRARERVAARMQLIDKRKKELITQ